MKIYDFLDLLIDSTLCEIFDFSSGETIATADSDDIKDSKFADFEIASFEICNNKLIINIDSDNE